MEPSSGARQTPILLMHGSFLYTGAGTLLLGPVLPLFAAQWGLHDAQSGGLIAAIFFGLFFGSIAMSRNLRGNLLCGAALSMSGFVILASLFAHRLGFYPGLMALFLTGVGLGQITTTVNLLSAVRYHEPHRRSSALSMLNFTWSAGAVLSPLIAAVFLRHGSVPNLLRCFGGAGAFLLSATLLLLKTPKQAAAPTTSATESGRGIPLQPLAFFMLLFFLYGGLEATLNGWLSTYTIRYTTLTPAKAAVVTTFLWASFAAGRAISAFLLLRGSEQWIRAGGILLSVTGVVALHQAHTGRAIAVCATLVGLGIAPFFAVTFSSLVARHPLPRQAGTATSMIGLGSSALPYLVGVLSSTIGSLRGAMLVPIALAAGLLTLCLLPIGVPPTERRGLPQEGSALAK